MTQRRKKESIDFGAIFGTSSASPDQSFPQSGVFSESVQGQQEETKQIQPLAVIDLLDNPYQPRSVFREESLQELAQTIQTQGFQGVLVARPHPDQPSKYQISVGHRRREAARLAGLTRLPVIIQSLTNQEMAQLAITENIQREDLTPLEEGRIFQLMIQQFGLTQEQVADGIHKNRSYVRNRLRVVQAPEDIQHLVEARPDTLRAIERLEKIEDTAERAPLIEQLRQGAITADHLAAYIEERNTQGISDEPKEPLPVIAVKNVEVDQDLVEHVLAPATATSMPQVEEEQASSTLQQGAEERLRISKLKTLQKQLGNYQRSIPPGTSLSPNERRLLLEIAHIAQEIYDRKHQNSDYRG